MNKEKLYAYIGSEEITLVDAMEKIDQNSKGVLFIVNAKGELSGCVTDGDIRRWLINTGELSALVGDTMTKTPVALFEEERDKAQSLMRSKGINALPIINRKRQLKDIVFLSDTEGKAPSQSAAELPETSVVIMAGGKGTRLYPYTKILPKPLIPIGDTPIVERILNCFAEYNIRDFHMTVNYKKGMIKSYFADINLPFNINYVEENIPLGTGGSLKLIEKKFDKPLFVANCDSLIRADYGKIYDYHLQAGNAITMVAALKNIVIPYGVLHSKENGELTDMEEKPKMSYLINTGMYVINPEVIDYIPDNKMFHMTHLVERIREEGLKVGVFPVSEDSFLDMGEFEEMRRMEEKLNIDRG